MLPLQAIQGIFPASQAANGEDVTLYADDANFEADTPSATMHMLRQQLEKETQGSPYLSLADFVAPRSAGKDHLGMFVVSVFGCDKLVSKYEAENDDYNKIMAQSLADRLAEAYAELLHREMRTTTWGYAPNEVSSSINVTRPWYGASFDAIVL